MLRVLRLYLKVPIFQPELLPIFQPELQEHAPRTTFVLTSCDFQAGAAADKRGIEPATAGLQKQARKPQDISRATKSHGATARALRHARSPQRVRRRAKTSFVHLDHADLRRGSRGHIKKRKDLHLDHADPRRGFIRAPQRIAFPIDSLCRALSLSFPRVKYLT